MQQRSSARLRWLVVWVVAVVWMGAVLARLSYLQLFCYSEYFAKAQRQQQHVFEISPMRGVIYDRKGRELAISIPDGLGFRGPYRHLRILRWWRGCFRAPSTSPPKNWKQKSAKPASPSAWPRNLSPETVERIEDMNLKGVFFEKENRRVYPQA